MKLKDPGAISALRRANVYELETMLADFPEEDRNGRNDWEMIANEAGWLLDSYRSYDCVRHDDLQESREISAHLAAIEKSGIRPLTAYEKTKLESARKAIAEYNRLVRFVTRLKARGLHCPYC